MENQDINNLPTDNGVSSGIAGDTEPTNVVGDGINSTVTNSVTQESELNLNLEDGASQTSTETVQPNSRVSTRELNNLLSANTAGLSEDLNPVLPRRSRPNYQQMKQEFENALGTAINRSKTLPKQRESPLLPDAASRMSRSLPCSKLTW